VLGRMKEGPVWVALIGEQVAGTAAAIKMRDSGSGEPMKGLRICLGRNFSPWKKLCERRAKLADSPVEQHFSPTNLA